jgi:CheY-like chemotaxis protein
VSASTLRNYQAAGSNGGGQAADDPTPLANRQGSVTPVLIVDDDPDVRRMIRLLLETSGYETISAANGAEALERLHECRPCVVLLDMMMPVMDGFEFRRQQLSDPDISDVPVICLTGHYEPGQVTTQLKAPCLQKPPYFPQILDAVGARCGVAHDPAPKAEGRDTHAPSVGPGRRSRPSV